MTVRNAACAAAAALCLLAGAVATTHPARAQDARRAITIDARSATELRDWDRRLDTMLRQGELRVRGTREDTLIKGRTHQRADQVLPGRPGVWRRRRPTG